MAGVLAVLMGFSVIPFTQSSPVVFAKEQKASSVNQFHYEQLSATAKHIYDGLCQMYETGLLKTGTADYDLAKNGQFSQAECEELSKNTKKLNDAMNAARYAFYADYPEVFYVNFPKLNVRPTKDSDGGYHIYLGSGRYADYYLDGFDNKAQVDKAVTAFDARVKEIAEGARGVKVSGNKNLQVEQIRYVHNTIINHVSYRMEDTCFEGNDELESNASYLGTPYGTLVKKQGVCEGYARAFKAVMDELGINSILVQGVHQYDSEVAVSHMWNYVELTDTGEKGRSFGGKWYAVDLTQDDPETFIVPEKELVDYTQHFDAYGEDGFENEKYFLAGQLTLNGRYFIDETIDAAGGYTFTYPSIEDTDYGVRDAVNDMDGFLVKQKTVPGNHGMDVTEYQISYKGMNATTARKQGIYLLAKYYDEDEDGNVVPLTGWCYFSDAYSFKEDDTSIYLQEGEVMYMEFAVTTVVPRPGLEGMVYAGDDFGLIARTGKIYNENRNGYQAPPFILRATPSQTATIYPGDSLYHIMLEYDEALTLEEGVSKDDLSIQITCRSGMGNEVTGAEYSKISNVTWDGNKIVEFDVEFSKMFADDSVIYNFYPQGLVGVESKKAPNPASYGVARRVDCPCVQNRRGSWELYGKPTLLEDNDLSLQDWTLSNGKAVSDKLTHRLTLVTTKTNEKQEAQMQDMMNQEMPGALDNVLESSTYNIALNICKSSFVKTGQKVKVKVGFPAGYGPDDTGVTFKAYHFSRDEQGNVVGVEEIDCVVTPYGLIVTCDAFSPFMIAAVKQDETDITSEKSVVVTTSDGGTITGDALDASKVLQLQTDGTAVLHVQPEDGFEIESITVCGETIEVSNADGMDVSVAYDVVGANNIVHANFVAKAVAAKDEKRAEAPVVASVEPVEVKLPETLSVGGKLDIVPEISKKPGVHSYQWYKDNEALPGETNAELHLKNAGEAVAGSYQLKVVTTLDTVSAEAMSNVCKVTIRQDCKHTNTTTHEAVASTCTKQGHAEYVTCDDCDVVVSGSDEKLPLAEHAFAEVVEERFLKSSATCTNPAFYFKSCSVCHTASKDVFASGEALGHQNLMIQGKRPVTCTSDGYTGNTFCTSCKTIVEEGSVILSAGHTITEVAAVDATCTTEGNIAYFVCSVCNKLFADAIGQTELALADTVLPKTGHTYEYMSDADGHWGTCFCGNTQEKEVHAFDEWVVTKIATDAEDGVKERSCSVCGYVETEVIPKGEHIISEDYSSDAEYHWKICSCGNVVEKDVHAFGEWVVTKEPVGKEFGTKERVCEVCGQTEVETIVELEHHYVSKYDETNHWMECDCGDVMDLAEHVFDEWSVTKEATETEAGTKERHCTDCAYVLTEEIPMLSHTHTYGDTYQSDAENHWKACACGDAVEKEAHTFGEWVVTKEATDIEVGSQERVCSVCQYKEVQEIPVTGGTDGSDNPTPNPDGNGAGQPDDTQTPDNGTQTPTNSDSSTNGDDKNQLVFGKYDGKEIPSVQTGDTNDMMVYLSLCVLSAFCIGAWFWRRKTAKQ